MRTFIICGVTFEVESAEAVEALEFVASMEEAKALIEQYRCTAYGEGSALYHKVYEILSHNLDATYYDPRYKAYNKQCNHDYFLLCAIHDEKYREYAEADFLEFAKHKGEEGFDWDFYSDWHKDLYGYRPRG